jgi:hypothetical protein
MNYTLEKLLIIPIDGVFKTMTNIKNKQEYLIRDFGLLSTEDKNKYFIKTNKFKYDDQPEITSNNSYIQEKKILEVPIFSLVKLPNFKFQNVEIEYDIEMIGSKNKKVCGLNQPISTNLPNNLNFKITLETK